MRLKRQGSRKRASHTVRAVTTTMLVVVLLLAGLLPRLPTPAVLSGFDSAWMAICGHGGGSDAPADAAMHAGCGQCCLIHVPCLLPHAVAIRVPEPLTMVRLADPTTWVMVVGKGERPFARGPPARV